MNNYFSIECVCCSHHALGYLDLAPHEIMNNYFSIENARGFHHALGYLNLALHKIVNNYFKNECARSFLRALGYSNMRCSDVVNGFSFGRVCTRKFDNAQANNIQMPRYINIVIYFSWNQQTIPV